MGRPKKPFPPQPKRDGQKMRVWWTDRWHHLGRVADEPGWKAEYARLITVWKDDPTAAPLRPDDYLVSTLCRDYLASPDSPTGDQQRARVVTAIDLLLDLYPESPVAEFGPNDLRAWQRRLCELPDPKDPGRARFNVTSVKDLVRAVRRIWKWGVSTERVAVERYQALMTVSPPRVDEARPPKEVPPADPDHVKPTLPHLRPPTRAMVVLQWAAGARPEELCGMKAGDVRRSGRVHIPGAGVQDLDAEGVWVYVPPRHKTTWKRKTRFLTFAGEAKKVLEPFLGRAPDAYCFDPGEALADLHAEQRREREARGGGSGGNRKKPAAAPSRRPGRRYTPRTYRQAVMRACVAAGVPHWFPYQLRHLRAAELKAVFDLDAVQALLGHHTKTMAEHYGGVSFKKAAEVARKMSGG